MGLEAFRLIANRKEEAWTERKKLVFLYAKFERITTTSHASSRSLDASFLLISLSHDHAGILSILPMCDRKAKVLVKVR
jgi:hypothetical protein